MQYTPKTKGSKLIKKNSRRLNQKNDLIYDYSVVMDKNQLISYSMEFLQVLKQELRERISRQF